MTDHRAINQTSERVGAGGNGGLLLLLLLATSAVGAMMLARIEDSPLVGLPGIVLIALSVFGLAGFYSLQPNEGCAITLFGAD